MKFATVELGHATGGILAHSVSLGKHRLRKGRVLSESDIAALAGAEIAEVTVALLDADDVDENTAARMLADALVPEPAAAHLRVTDAFTGRVNLLAVGAGVAVLDEAALQAVNRVHPMITLASVPPHQQMRDGGMVATIKIISYGVPKAAIEQACELAADAIRLASRQIDSVALIVTEIRGGAGDKGKKAIADRVAAFDLELPDPILVEHDTIELAQAIQDSTAELTLILTGSATSDIDDVAPAALRMAGGRVERFGMPVDPGNLLFLGSLAERPVIGLPGCARSPALNGADWIMARVICGLTVTSDDVSAMGVGGLLKEIPTRPQPRAGLKKT